IGNTITITGDYFLTGAHTVTITGTACTSVTRVNVNTITAVVAPSTTSGQVIVTSPRGMHNGYTITINTPPTITVQPTAPATVCGGSGTRTMTVT
ncbi:IPT/TIG domain-containing protein, partial [Flavobacterium sp. LMO9]|uniref:IPT/TIG domain-containing protein n=1 Tax=Flavobacterium sp. LMO9 TaxID=2654245 RepID=UPI00193948B7